MANLKASKRGIKVSERNRQRNKHLKTVLKGAIKAARTAIDSFSENSESVLKASLRVIDRMVSRGIIKKNTAARNKSRLMKAFRFAQTK